MGEIFQGYLRVFWPYLNSLSSQIGTRLSRLEEPMEALLSFSEGRESDARQYPEVKKKKFPDLLLKSRGESLLLS
jgi:hypothetical protein